MEANRRTRLYQGIFFMVLSALFFTFMNAFVRLAGDVPSMQKSFFRNFIAVIFAFAVLRKNKVSLLPQKASNLKFLLVRSIAGTIGVLCNFYAVDHLALSDASMLNKMSPFFAVIFSVFFLKEKASGFQTGVIIIAFLGALLVVKPGFDSSHLVPSLIGLAGGISAGAAYSAVRLLGNRGEKGPYIVFFFSAFSCIMLLPNLILHFQPMSLKQTAFLLAAGLAAAGGQFSITAAYCKAPAREVSVYDYSQVVFAAILGYFLFGQIPDGLSTVGYLVIISMGTVMFLYNKKQFKV